MNILTDDLPVSVVIDDKVYALNTDYRTGLTIMEAFEDQGLTDQEKALVMLELLYPEVPRNIGGAAKALWFLNCGEPAIASDNNQPEERRYSFTQDARYIYTAILQTHGIDLERTEYLHWWKFQYLFLDLREDCFLAG